MPIDIRGLLAAIQAQQSLAQATQQGNLQRAGLIQQAGNAFGKGNDAIAEREAAEEEQAANAAFFESATPALAEAGLSTDPAAAQSPQMQALIGPLLLQQIKGQQATGAAEAKAKATVGLENAKRQADIAGGDLVRQRLGLGGPAAPASAPPATAPPQTIPGPAASPFGLPGGSQQTTPTAGPLSAGLSPEQQVAVARELRLQSAAGPVVAPIQKAQEFSDLADLFDRPALAQSIRDGQLTIGTSQELLRIIDAQTDQEIAKAGEKRKQATFDFEEGARGESEAFFQSLGMDVKNREQFDTRIKILAQGTAEERQQAELEQARANTGIALSNLALAARRADISEFSAMTSRMREDRIASEDPTLRALNQVIASASIAAMFRAFGKMDELDLRKILAGETDSEMIDRFASFTNSVQDRVEADAAKRRDAEEK